MLERTYDLSVIVVSHNVLDLTRECLRSIYENTREVALEVILVDNASTDGTPEMVEREFPEVCLIKNPVGMGLAVANNQGLEASRGRYVLTLNSDTVVQPGSFDTLVRFMDEHPDAGGATPRLILPAGSPHPRFCGKVPTFWSELLAALSPLHGSIAAAVPRARFGDDMDYGRTREIACVLWGTAFVVRRDAFNEIGFQDPRFFIYSEDVDWSMRITKAGWKLYYVADAGIIHYGGQSTKQASARMLAQLSKSKCRLIQKHYGLTAGLALRLAIAGVWGIRMSKWTAIFLFRGRVRQEAAGRLSTMRQIICAVLTY